jgi:nocardicin N-oxygenase
MTDSCPFSIPAMQDEVVVKELDDQFDAMRCAGSLAWSKFPYGTVNDGMGWVASGNKEVKAILKDNRFSIAQQQYDDYPRARVKEAGAPFPLSFITMDPPDHTERRRTLMKHLTPKRVESLRPFTREIVNDCLDEIERIGHGADIIANLVQKVPLYLLCELLGAPREERGIYFDHAHMIVNSRHKTVEEATHSFDTLKNYFAELCDRKRAQPGADLISDLVHDVEVNGVWTKEELDGVGTVMLIAGHDSTSSTIANILYWLVHNPDVFARLRSRPNEILNATDEFLRLLPVGVPGTRTRIALEDVQFGDTLVRRNESVLAVPHAANLDPEIFENPRTFDLDRSNSNKHIAFGFGIHFCPGSILAKMDIEMVLRGVTERFDHLEPVSYDPDWEMKSRTRGPKSLPVKW